MEKMEEEEEDVKNLEAIAADFEEEEEPSSGGGVAAQIASLREMIRGSDDPGRKRFLEEFMFRVESAIQSFASLDELHYALFEEWQTITRAAPWVASEAGVARSPSKRKPTHSRRAFNVVCCHFKKSTIQRPVLEAECRANGVEFTSSTNRFELAELLDPNLPGFCERHGAQRGAQSKKRRALPSSTDAAEKVGTVYMRGELIFGAAPAAGLGEAEAKEQEPRTARLSGLWSAADNPRDWEAARTFGAAWRFEYSSVDGAKLDGTDSQFAGFFRVEEATIFETKLTMAIRPRGGAAEEEYVLEGQGTNQYGDFRMRGFSRAGDLTLLRDYVLSSPTPPPPEVPAAAAPGTPPPAPPPPPPPPPQQQMMSFRSH